MTDLCIRSIFRDSATYTDQYFFQVKALLSILNEVSPGHYVHLVLLEGNSRDDTYAQLERHLAELPSLFPYISVTSKLIKFDVPPSIYDRFAIKDVEVFRRIATCWNKNLDEKCEARVNFMVESDFLWDGSAMAGTILGFKEQDTVLSPPSRHEGGPLNDEIYDTWGYRRGRYSIDGAPTYWHQCPEDHPANLWMRMEKIGGVSICDSIAMSKVVCDLDTCIMNWDKSTKVYMHRGIVVWHPRH